MTSKIAAVLKGDHGALLPYTCQSTMERCEEWCAENILHYDKVKECGAKVVQVEIRELTDVPAQAAVPKEAAERVAKYLQERSRAHQMDLEEVTSIHAGSEREARLLTADLDVLAQYILGQVDTPN